MRKKLIEQTISKIMHRNLATPQTDTIHPIDEYLPKGTPPLNSSEKEYARKRLLEEYEKMTEYLDYIYGP